jgi:hypothetical protein
MTTGSAKVRRRLAAAEGSQRGVSVRRRSEPGESIAGFVLGVGRTWLLLARTSEGGYFDGHIAVRLRDIATVRFDKSFQPRFSRMQEQWPPALPPGVDRVDLDSTRGVLTTMLPPDVLVGIQSDRRSGAMWIGRPYGLSRHRFYLWEAAPDATWHPEPLGYRLRRTVTIETGGQYLTALGAMVDAPPQGAAAAPWRSAPR